MENKHHEEIWRDIVGFEGLYQVSDLGRVRSLDRIVLTNNNQQRSYKGKLLNTISDSRSYPSVNLKRNSKQFPRQVHALVAAAFLPDPTCSSHIHHIDGDQLNNKVSNLERKSISEHIIQHGVERRSDIKSTVISENYVKPLQFIPSVNIENEIWVPLVGFEGIFEISNYGRFKRLKRLQNRIGHTKNMVLQEKILTMTNKSRRGYLQCRLIYNGGVFRKVIHRLVAQHFLSNSNQLPIVHHKDGNRLNNFVGNLEWVGERDHQNIHSKHKHRLMGSEHPNALLNEDMVYQIKELGSQGKLAMYGIANIFGVSTPTISAILNGKLWKHVIFNKISNVQ